MDAPPKKPHAIGWYAAWIVLALVPYVASQGPAVYTFIAWGGPDWLWNAVAFGYHPLNLWCQNGLPGSELIDAHNLWWQLLADTEARPRE